MEYLKRSPRLVDYPTVPVLVHLDDGEPSLAYVIVIPTAIHDRDSDRRQGGATLEVVTAPDASSPFLTIGEDALELFIAELQRARAATGAS